jgi:hypothetical protein
MNALRMKSVFSRMVCAFQKNFGVSKKVNLISFQLNIIKHFLKMNFNAIMTKCATSRTESAFQHNHYVQTNENVHLIFSSVNIFKNI